MKPILSFIRRVMAVLAILAIATSAASSAQAQTGKLSGVVSDSATGQPIEGAQVVLDGTGYGALSQSNGRYFIIAIPPGTYGVTARRIGYQSVRTTAAVRIDVTREINFTLSSSSASLSAVRIVTNTAPLVELSQTGTTQQISSEELEALPVRSITDALTLQSGFAEIPTISTDLTSFTSSRRNSVAPILVRGGRAGETMTLIDGIPVNNFLFGGPTLDLTRKAVESVQVIKGGFEPQYGNALSGIVNIATKEGGAIIRGSVEYETSRLGGAAGNLADELRGYDFIEGFLSGPVPATAEKLRFVVAGRTQNQAGSVLEYDNQIYNPFVTDTARRFTYRNDLIAGYRAQGFRNQRDLFGKLTYLFTQNTKMSATYLDYGREVMQVPFDWIFTGTSSTQNCINAYQSRYGGSINVADVCGTAYNGDQVSPAGRPTGSERLAYTNPAVITQGRQLGTLKFEQTISRLNYRVVGGVFTQKRQTCATFFSGVCLGERIADTNFNGRFVTAGVTSAEITPTEGTDEIAGDDEMRTRLVRADAQLQASDHHNLAMGFFYQGHDISFREVRDVGLNNIQLQASDYSAKPWDAAVYLQDRIEYDFLTVRLGARFDYAQAKGQFLRDPLDPTNGTTLQTVCDDPARFGLPSNFATFTVDTTLYRGLAACTQSRALGDSATRVAFRDDMGTAPVRRAFSPRLGLSFPVSDRSSTYVNFGVYYQNPLYNNVYQGTGIGTANEGTPEGPAFRNGTFVGNPRLAAERTTSYEVGFVTEIGTNYSTQIVAFSKDQSGLTGIRSGGLRDGVVPVFDPGVTYGTNAPSYTILVNQDYQTVRGFELELRRRLASYWSAKVNYGYSQATTNAAPPDLEEQQVNQEGDVPARREIRSDIDQTHSLNGTFSLRFDNQVPKFRFSNVLKHTRVSSTVRVASGFPYTPSLTFSGGTSDRLERNSGTAPTTFRIDMEATKDFGGSNVRYGTFVRVTNVLDRRNCVQVFATTGNCDGGASPQSRLSAGNFTGESDGTTFFDRPQYVADRRSINAGVRVNF